RGEPATGRAVPAPVADGPGGCPVACRGIRSSGRRLASVSPLLPYVRSQAHTQGGVPMYQARISRRQRAAFAAASFGLGLAAFSTPARAGPGDTPCPGSPPKPPPPFNPAPEPPPPPPPPGGDVEFDDLLQELVPQVVEPDALPPQLLPGKNRVTAGEGLSSH